MFDDQGREYFTTSDQEYKTFTWQGVSLSKMGLPPIHTRPPQMHMATEGEMLYHVSIPPLVDPLLPSFNASKNERVEETGLGFGQSHRSMGRGQGKAIKFTLEEDRYDTDGIKRIPLGSIRLEGKNGVIMSIVTRLDLLTCRNGSRNMMVLVIRTIILLHLTKF